MSLAYQGFRAKKADICNTRLEQQGERTDDSDSVVGAVTFETSILLENILRNGMNIKFLFFSSAVASSHNLPILE